MTESSIVSLLQWVVGGLVGWNVYLTTQLISMKVELAGQYHKRPEIEAIVDRLMKSVSQQISVAVSDAVNDAMKTAVQPLIFRVGAIYAHMKLPEPKGEPG